MQRSQSWRHDKPRNSVASQSAEVVIGKVKRAPPGSSKHTGAGWALNGNSAATSVNAGDGAPATGVAIRREEALFTIAVCVGAAGAVTANGAALGISAVSGKTVGDVKFAAALTVAKVSRLNQAEKVVGFKSWRRQNSACDKPLTRQSRTRPNQSARRCR